MKNHMDFQKAKINLSEAFAMQTRGEMIIEGMAPGHPLAPSVNSLYVFNQTTLRDMVTFWLLGLKAMKLVGDPGTGKTSLVEQWHARLGLPLFMMSCHENMTDCDLIGQYQPRADGTLEWVDSPVMKVHRFGGSVLLDEWNNLNPNAASTLNAILDGYSVTIPQTGEVVKQHKDARFFCTQNPVDGQVAVQGRYVQDSASDDRFMEVNVDYLEPTVEQEVVAKELLSLHPAMAQEQANTTAKSLVSVANEVRKAFRNNHKPEFADVVKPMSTRVITRWAKLLIGYQMQAINENPAMYALERAYSAGADAKKAVLKIAGNTLGA